MEPRPLTDQAAAEVLQVRGRGGGEVCGPVGAQDTAALGEERISHQGTDQGSQAREEMQGLRRNRQEPVCERRGDLQLKRFDKSEALTIQELQP